MSEQRVVIVGASLAGAKAAETLREEGFDGRIELIGAEGELPYERPPLSKDVLLGKEDAGVAQLHDEEWYADRQIDLRLGTRVERLDLAARVVWSTDGEEIGYDKLLLATGSSVRRLDVPGDDLDGVCYLRTIGESKALREALRDRPRTVVVGAGWIGLEVAAAARENGAEVTLIEPQRTALAKVLGPEIGERFAELHRRHGVDLRFGTGVREFAGTGRVTAVRTDQGDEIPAELVVVGVGVRPNTELAAAAGLELAEDGGIVTDARLRTSDPDVFAAGDVARWEHPLLGCPVRVEHWSNAQDSGAAAAKAILGQDAAYDAIPFFFTDQYDLGMEYAGYVPAETSYDVVLRGDPESGAYLAFWLGPDGRLLAGMHVNTWDTMDAVQDLIRRGAKPDPTRLADPEVQLSDLS